MPTIKGQQEMFPRAIRRAHRRERMKELLERIIQKQKAYRPMFTGSQLLSGSPPPPKGTCRR